MSQFRQKATSALPEITPDVILKTYAGDFEKAKRNDEIRAKLAAGTSIRLG